jgi:hypothetical protein
MQCAATGGGSCAVLNSQIKIFVEQVCPFVICEGSGHVLTFKNCQRGTITNPGTVVILGQRQSPEVNPGSH